MKWAALCGGSPSYDDVIMITGVLSGMDPRMVSRASTDDL